jgi:hypothetical protein
VWGVKRQQFAIGSSDFSRAFAGCLRDTCGKNARLLYPIDLPIDLGAIAILKQREATTALSARSSA